MTEYIMLTEKQFNVLRYLSDKLDANIQDVSKSVDLSLDEVESILSWLKSEGFVDGIRITSSGLNVLSPYKVDNAIILAAGMATRFVPVSYEIPKGLISVKGEPLIERQIRQLKEAGIGEIIVVIGYMMEKFLYLRDKYGVKFVVNNEFAVKNTHSSIYAARDYLKNTLILCADNYYTENMFHKYEYRAFYCSVFLPGTGYAERSMVTDEDGKVIDTHKPSHDEWIMYGHAYWDKAFSTAFKPLLESYYGRPGIENYYWETIWAENLDVSPMYIKKCKHDVDNTGGGVILEFDSVSELEAYDKDYILNNSTSIISDICSILYCEPNDINDFQAMKAGINNKSFSFMCKGSKYVYRYPGKNAEGIIDRKKEAYCQRWARDLGIDTTLVYIDVSKGWKISRFLETSREFDFSDKVLVKGLAEHLKTLHEANIVTGSKFSFFDEADKLIEIIRRNDFDSYTNILSKREEIILIYNEIKNDNWQVSLCHNDIYAPNILVSCDEKVTLIDWEFAGDSDIGYDIIKLFSNLNPDFSEIDEYLSLYYGRPTTVAEKKHLYGCAAVCYFYWFVWAVYVSKNGTSIQDYMIGWYDRMNKYKDLYSKF